MKLPRNLTGAQLIKTLEQLGYRTTRQTGSHVRLTSHSAKEHHITPSRCMTRYASAHWHLYFQMLHRITA